MEKITYLFGAGASCNCLPIYSNFNERFKSFIEFIKTEVFPIFFEKQAAKKDLLAKLQFYSTEFAFHSTPDTYAKKLFHTQPKDELDKFKAILIVFFIYEQIQNFSISSTTNSVVGEEKQPFDKRYDAFIAALLKPIPEKIEFLDNIKVLTWNYDLQFEIAFMQYVQKTNIYLAQDRLQSLPKLKDIGFTSLKVNEKLSIIHLNGIAYPHVHETSFVELRIGSFFTDKKPAGAYLLEVYISMINDELTFNVSNFQFAWESVDESFNITNSTLRRALEDKANTKTLIINGYSFPIFNRAIDVKLIENMTSLKRIYIQDKYSANSIKQILETFVPNILKVQIFDLGFYNQFYIPEMFKREHIPLPPVFGNYKSKNSY